MQVIFCLPGSNLERGEGEREGKQLHFTALLLSPSRALAKEQKTASSTFVVMR